MTSTYTVNPFADSWLRRLFAECANKATGDDCLALGTDVHRRIESLFNEPVLVIDGGDFIDGPDYKRIEERVVQHMKASMDRDTLRAYCLGDTHIADLDIAIKKAEIVEDKLAPIVPHHARARGKGKTRDWEQRNKKQRRR